MYTSPIFSIYHTSTLQYLEVIFTYKLYSYEIINYAIIIIEKGHPMSYVELDLHVTWRGLTSTCVSSKLWVS